jgi:hypothetical protein
MKFRKLIPITAMLVIALMSGCNKDLGTNGSDLLSGNKSANKSKSGLLPGVNLGVAGNFAILTKSGITDVYRSDITGDIGTSPITGAALLVSCAEVTGSIYTVDVAGPLPCRLTNATMLSTAVLDMQAAYTDAAGRINPDFLNLGAGSIGGKTLTPGLYKWTSAVTIPTDVTISGGPDDVFIFQIDGTLIMSSAVKIILSGGVQAKNIFWQTAGAVTLGTTSHFEGIILGQTGINLQTGATLNGRLLAQTAVTLEMNTVKVPLNTLSTPVSPVLLTAVLSNSGVDLKSALRFGILSAAAVTSVGPSVINNMDIGIYPGVRASITGFLPGIIVNGAIYASDDIAPLGTSAMLLQAKQDLSDAYHFAESALSPAPILVAGDQGGKTLTPGIYKSTSSLLVQSGNLTLDAKGDSNAFWIFQVASALTTVGGAGGNVILAGGAQAKNIFWQVGSSATIGDYTAFQGNVLALTSITMDSGSTLVGRLLASNAAVTLTSANIVTLP